MSFSCSRHSFSLYIYLCVYLLFARTWIYKWLPGPIIDRHWGKKSVSPVLLHFCTDCTIGGAMTSRSCHPIPSSAPAPLLLLSHRLQCCTEKTTSGSASAAAPVNTSEIEHTLIRCNTSCWVTWWDRRGSSIQSAIIRDVCAFVCTVGLLAAE